AGLRRRGNRDGLLHADADYGIDLGQADLGHLVDLGFAAYDLSDPVVALRRISGAARAGRRHARDRAPGGGGRDRRSARRADYSRVGPAVAHDSSRGAGDKARLARTGRSPHDRDAAGRDGGLYGVLRVALVAPIRDAARARAYLAAQAPIGAGRRR